MQLQTLTILTLTNSLFARASPLPAPNAIANVAGHVISIADDAKVRIRSTEPMGSGFEEHKVAAVAGIAGNNDYTAEDAEFYVRSVEGTGGL